MSRLNQQLIDLSYQVDELKADLFRSQEQFEAIDDQAEEAKTKQDELLEKLFEENTEN